VLKHFAAFVAVTAANEGIESFFGDCTGVTIYWATPPSVHGRIEREE